jgi:endonuclease/exonuclease/phosphatase family metal-dependent hydrolase
MTSGRPSVACHALLVALVSLAIAAAPAGVHIPSSGQAPPSSVRRTAPLSDVLTHSPLASCQNGQLSDAKPRKPLRVATWNIQVGLSAPLDELAAELRAMEADIIGLQEVDYRVRRTGFIDQAQALATALSAHYVFAASIKWDEGDYGLAVVSRWPLVEVRRHRLDQAETGEPRIVLEVTVCADGRPLRLFNHHADVRSRSRQSGLAQLRELVASHINSGVIVLGDFNDGPAAPGLRGLLDAGLVDLGAEQNVPTAAGGRLDYLLVDRPLAKRVRRAEVWRTDKSDHHAVIAEFEW